MFIKYWFRISKKQTQVVHTYFFSSIDSLYLLKWDARKHPNMNTRLSINLSNKWSNLTFIEIHKKILTALICRTHCISIIDKEKNTGPSGLASGDTVTVKLTVSVVPCCLFAVRLARFTQGYQICFSFGAECNKIDFFTSVYTTFRENWKSKIRSICCRFDWLVAQIWYPCTCQTTRRRFLLRREHVSYHYELKSYLINFLDDISFWVNVWHFYIGTAWFTNQDCRWRDFLL